MADQSFDPTPAALFGLVLATLRTPRPTLRRLLALELPTDVLWTALFAIATAAVLLGQVTALVLVPGEETIDSVFLAAPLLMAGIQAVVLVITVFAMHHIGRLMGGAGRLQHSLAALVWLQFVMLAVQIVQTAALLLSPFLAEVITLAGLGILLWLFTAFVAEVHGFRNLALVFVSILVSAFAISIALTLVLSILGVTITGGPDV